jgi:hypothetical protein
VKTSTDGLAQQHAIAMRSYEGLKQVHDALTQVRKLRSQLRDLRGRAPQGALADAINALDRKAAALEGAGGGLRGGGGGTGRASAEPSLNAVNGELLGLMRLVEGADVTPTTQAVAASEQSHRTLAGVLSRWSELRDKDVRTLNEQLAKARLPTLTN